MGYSVAGMFWICIWCTQMVAGLKQEWTFKQETRRQFLIERFGFEANGYMKLNVNVNDDANIHKASILFVHVNSCHR